MTNNKEILEHEILKTIFTKTSFQKAGYALPSGISIPIFKRDYHLSYLHFGTLVDALNNPLKYNAENSLQDLKKDFDTISVSKFEWIEVSAAIDVLVYNGHIEDDTPIDKFSQPTDRKIRITPQGCIAYRNNHYFKEREKADLERQQIQSVIETNKSVKKTNKWIKTTSFLSLFIAAITGFYIVRQAINDAKYPILQKATIFLDSLNQSEKGIDSSLRSIANDSIKIF